MFIYYFGSKLDLFVLFRNSLGKLITFVEVKELISPLIWTVFLFRIVLVSEVKL